MAFVTRCPYCGCIWRLPNKQTAEVGPVKCSSCRHSFDATSQILEVPDELLIVHCAKKSAIAEGQEDFAPVMRETQAPKVSMQTPVSRVQPSTVQPVLDKAPPPPAPLPLSEPIPPEKIAPADEPVASPSRAEPNLIKIQPLEPVVRHKEAVATERSTHAGPQQTTDKIPNIVPAQEKMPIGQPRHDEVSPHHSHVTNKNTSQIGAFVSVVLMAVLIVVIICVCAIIFNRRIATAIPQTEPLFNTVCQKITCPGFYLRDINAFAITKTQLKALDESGNYVLDVSLMNGSRTAQAVPSLELELVDDTDTTLQRRLLRPDEYLLAPDRTPSIAPDRTMHIRINLKTNTAPTRCIVRPTYAD